MCYSASCSLGFPKDRKWAWAMCYCLSTSASKSFSNYKNRVGELLFQIDSIVAYEDYILFTSCKGSQQIVAIHIINFWPLTFIAGEVILKVSSHGFNALSYTSLMFNLCIAAFPSLTGYNSWNKKHPQLDNSCMAVSGTQQAVLTFMLQWYNWLPHELNHTFIVSCHSSCCSCCCCHGSCIIYRDDCLAAISTGWF
jgi:hypothetical protein